MSFSARQIAYRDLRLSGMSRKNAALKAGYSVITARSKVRSEELDRYVGLVDVLEQQGVTNHFLAEELKCGLRATQAVVLSKSYWQKDENGKNQKVTESYVTDRPNWAVRAKYIEIILNLSGKAKPVEDANKNSTFVINLIRSTPPAAVPAPEPEGTGRPMIKTVEVVS
jgi:hypothetical protein